MAERRLDLSHLSNNSTRSQWVYWMESSGVGVAWDILQILLSLIAMALYIVSTYQDEKPTWIFLLEVALTLVFTVDYCLRMYLAENKFDHFFSFFPMVDFMSIIPFVIEEIYKSVSGVDNNGPTLQFLRLARFLRIMRLLRIMKMYRIFRLAKTEVERGILELIFIVSCLVFISAGLMYEAESVDNPKFEYFHSTLYFIVVALSTVGFGDIFPESALGRTLMMFIICAGLVIVPLQTSRVIELVALERKYLGAYIGRPDARHIVVAGHLSAEEILGFIKEFYHVNHTDTLRDGMLPTSIVFLSPKDPTPAMEDIINSPALPSNTLKYLKGSLTDDKSMERALLSNAKAVFLLADNFAPPDRDEDSANILALIVMIRHLMSVPPSIVGHTFGGGTVVDHRPSRGKVKTFIQVMDTKNESRVAALPMQTLRCTVGVHSLKMRILGFGCSNPGGLALLHNLTRSFAFSERLDRPASTASTTFDAYLAGIDNEIYQIDLTVEGGHWKGKTFQELTSRVYATYGALVIGIEKGDAHSGGSISRTKIVQLELKPPSDFVIGLTGGTERAYVVATSKDVAQQVETWNPEENPGGPPTPRRSRSRRPTWVGLAKVTPAPEEQYVRQVVDIPQLQEELLVIAKQMQRGALAEDPLPPLPPAAQPNATQLTPLSQPLPIPNTLLGPGDEGPAWDSPHLPLGPHARSGATPLQRGSNLPMFSMATKDTGVLQGHILICGPLKGLDILITSIHQDPQRRNQIIVVLDPHHTEEQKLHLEEQFIEEVEGRRHQCVFVVNGSCRVEADLQRVHFHCADRVIVLADYLSSQEDVQGVARDMSAVLVSMSPSGDTPPLLFFELVEADNTKYLHPLEIIPSGVNNEYSLWPQFCAGKVWPSSTLDSLICQVFYSQALLITLEALLPRMDSPTQQPTLWQIPVPPSLQGKTFQVALDSLMVVDGTPMMPIGVLRNPPSNVYGQFSEMSSNGLRRASRRPSHACPAARERAGSTGRHFLLERTGSELEPSPTPSEPVIAASEAASDREKENELCCSIVCPPQDLKLVANDVLFVLGDKDAFLGGKTGTPSLLPSMGLVTGPGEKVAEGS